MPITSKDLLDHLSDLQLALEDYSFEKMTVEQAHSVKDSYDHFRNQLETCIWGTPDNIKIPEQKSVQNIQYQRDGVISAIGHDLRNPLHSILGFARVLAEAPLQEPYKSIASSVCMASESMTETLEELCAFSRMKDTHPNEVSIPFSLSALLGQVRDYAHLMLLDKPVNISLDMEFGNGQHLIGNPSDLRRILLNLIENACRFTLEGEIKVEAKIATKTTGDELCIVISDTGIGIPEAELPHIFKPYYQGKQTMELARKGAGFGLSVARQLLTRHDGQLSVKSIEGRGSSLCLILPCLTVSQTKGNGMAPANTQLELEVLKGMRILILENDPLNFDVLQMRLETQGCELFSASCVEEAIQLLEAEPLDVLLLDFRCSKEKDIKALKAIRTHTNPNIRNFPILGMSADPSEAPGGQWLKIGIDAFLPKPHSAEALYQKIVHLFQQTRTEQKAWDRPQKIKGEALALLDLDYLRTKCNGDSERLKLLLRALRNGLLEFAGRTRIGLNRGDYHSIADGAEKLLIALDMIGSQRLIPIVAEIRQASMEGTDENRIVRAFSAYLDQYREVVDALKGCDDS